VRSKRDRTRGNASARPRSASAGHGPAPISSLTGVKILPCDAIATATEIWTRINLVNLREHILPTRARAGLILKKEVNHLVSEVALRRL
jgi:hypothetical protein